MRLTIGNRREVLVLAIGIRRRVWQQLASIVSTSILIFDGLICLFLIVLRELHPWREERVTWTAYDLHYTMLLGHVTTKETYMCAGENPGVSQLHADCLALVYADYGGVLNI